MLSIVCTQVGMRSQAVIWLLLIARHLYNIQSWCGLGEDKKTNTIKNTSLKRLDGIFKATTFPITITK